MPDETKKPANPAEGHAPSPTATPDPAPSGGTPGAAKPDVTPAGTPAGSATPPAGPVTNQGEAPWKPGSPKPAPGAPAPATVNAKDTGTKGDGKADDTAAVQTAIDAVSDAGGGTVELPPGTFPIKPPATEVPDKLIITSGGQHILMKDNVVTDAPANPAPAGGVIHLPAGTYHITPASGDPAGSVLTVNLPEAVDLKGDLVAAPPRIGPRGKPLAGPAPAVHPSVPVHPTYRVVHEGVGVWGKGQVVSASQLGSADVINRLVAQGAIIPHNLT